MSFMDALVIQDADSRGIYNMKEKFQIAFFIVLLSYVAILFAGGYVSVYPTYFAIPTLAFLALFAFGGTVQNSVSIG